MKSIISVFTFIDIVQKMYKQSSVSVDDVEILQKIWENRTHSIFKSCFTNDKRNKIILKISKEISLPLQEEAQIMNQLCSIKAVPKILTHGYQQKKFYFATEFYELSLKNIIDNNSGMLSLQSTISLGISLLKIFETIHSQQIIYCNMCPENIMITKEGPDYENRIRLIGFSKSFMINYSKKISSSKRALIYQSRAFHEGKTLQVKDDLESLGYFLVRLRQGTLPWEQMSEMSMEKAKAWYFNSQELLNGMPQEFKQYFTYLSSNLKPKHDLLIKLLQTMLLKYCKSPQQAFGELYYLNTITEVQNDSQSNTDQLMSTEGMNFSINLNSLSILPKIDTDASVEVKIKALESYSGKIRLISNL